jgi:non-ribosomal peptide synthetase component F
MPLDIELNAAQVMVPTAEWNDTAHEVPTATLPQLVEAQVRLGPDETAVVSDDEVLGFGELDARANRLAHLLIERTENEKIILHNERDQNTGM